MSLYAVKNDEGDYLGSGGEALWTPIIDYAAVYNRHTADRWAAKYGGHISPLIEAPAKVVVSAEEADILKRAATERYPASFIMGAVASNDTLYADKESEDRLIRAYVNGWVIEKPKLYNVKVPHADGYWFYLRENHKPAPVSDHAYAREFTAAEIEHYGLGDCEKVRVE